MDAARWREVRALFDELVELAAGERAERLAFVGAADPELRAAVESLLTADALRSGALGAPCFAPRASDASARSRDPLGLAGRTVSHFQVQEPLGTGGMGVVYRAHDARLDRAVALKFLLPPYSLDAAAKARFLREAHAAAALDHVNLCTIHEVGEDADGRPFLAMALYPGETLKARLAREGPLPQAEALEIARQIAQGLARTHAAGIVHRDLKPANVMILPDGTVKILDFGLAKAQDQSVSETGARFGTVHYMAPEQIRGDAVDGRADLWALGVVLYELLTGRKPFGGEHEVAVAHAIVHHEPVPPRTVRRELSPALEDLVLTLLQKDPASRCATSEHLMRELSQAGAVRASAIRAVRARWRSARRMLAGTSRRAMAIGAALLIGAISYGVIAPSRHDGAAGSPARTAIAVLPFKNLSAEGPHAYLAGGLHAEILTQLFKVPALRVIGRTSVMGYGGPEAPPVRQIARELGVGSVVDATVQVVDERVRVNVQLIDATTGTALWVEQYDRTLEDALALQSEIARQIVATVGVALSSAERSVATEVPTTKVAAYLQYLQALEYQRRPGLLRRDLESAEQHYEQALALDPDFALARAALARVHGYMYWLRYDMTPERMARERAEAEAALRLDPDLPQAHVAMGHVHARRADSRAALEAYRSALRGLPNDPDTWRWVAQAHRRLGEWDEFAHAFERAVQLDPRNADLLWDQGGGTHRRMGRYAEAVRWYDQALSIAPDLHIASIARAWVFVSWKGELDTVRTVLRRSPADVELPEGASKTFHLARLYLYEREPDSLLRLLRDTGAPLLQTVTDFEPAWLWAAWAHQLRGDAIAARKAFDSALVFLDSAIVRYPDDWPVHAARGLALAGVGRQDEALSEVRWLLECDIYRRDRYLRPSVALAAARILVEANDADAAVELIGRTMAEEPSGVSVHALRLDPRWDRIRAHPRFRALITKYSQG